MTIKMTDIYLLFDEIGCFTAGTSRLAWHRESGEPRRSPPAYGPGRQASSRGRPAVAANRAGCRPRSRPSPFIDDGYGGRGEVALVLM